MPRINDAGLALIEHFEGLRLRAYPDPGTGGEPWTIGYGHTAAVHPGQAIDTAQAIAFLKSDVATAEEAVSRLVTVDISSNAFSALVSFQYNTGGLENSHLLGCVNLHDQPGVIAQFGRWVYAGGHVLQGLVTRRVAEAKLYATP